VIVRVVSVGPVRGTLEEAVRDYEARAGRYWRLEVDEVESGSRGRSDPRLVREAEGQRILPRLPAAGTVVALTRDGRTLASRELATFLGNEALASTAEVAFVLGGAFGLDHLVLARARLRLSLSGMTLPHELARVVLAEQLYRAGTILRGEPYHKGADDVAERTGGRRRR
jgi:23S rRNA (pseudouridine1915-N3)-methyltransferase